MGRETDRLLEEYLVAGARLGDRVAAGRLAMVRGPRLFAHAMRLLGNRADAEDIVQEAWIEILRGLGALRDDRAFPAWAYRIVTRRAARLVGGRIRQRETARAMAETAQPPIDATAHTDDAMTIRAALRQLPADHAATIALFYLEDMSVAEVALALDVPTGTVKTRLMHARARLHAMLEGTENEQT